MEATLKARENSRRVKEQYNGTFGFPGPAEQQDLLCLHRDDIFKGLEARPAYGKAMETDVQQLLCKQQLLMQQLQLAEEERQEQSPPTTKQQQHRRHHTQEANPAVATKGTAGTTSASASKATGGLRRAVNDEPPLGYSAPWLGAPAIEAGPALTTPSSLPQPVTGAELGGRAFADHASPTAAARGDGLASISMSGSGQRDVRHRGSGHGMAASWQHQGAAAISGDDATNERDIGQRNLDRPQSRASAGGFQGCENERLGPSAVPLQQPAHEGQQPKHVPAWMRDSDSDDETSSQVGSATFPDPTSPSAANSQHRSPFHSGIPPPRVSFGGSVAVGAGPLSRMSYSGSAISPGPRRVSFGGSGCSSPPPRVSFGDSTSATPAQRVSLLGSQRSVSPTRFSNPGSAYSYSCSRGPTPAPPSYAPEEVAQGQRMAAHLMHAEDLSAEEWARRGLPTDDRLDKFRAHSYEVSPTWDPTTNTVKRTARPDIFFLNADEAERRALAATENSAAFKRRLQMQLRAVDLMKKMAVDARGTPMGPQYDQYGVLKAAPGSGAGAMAQVAPRYLEWLPSARVCAASPSPGSGAASTAAGKSLSAASTLSRGGNAALLLGSAARRVQSAHAAIAPEDGISAAASSPSKAQSMWHRATAAAAAHSNSITLASQSQGSGSQHRTWGASLTNNLPSRLPVPAFLPGAHILARSWRARDGSDSGSDVAGDDDSAGMATGHAQHAAPGSPTSGHRRAASAAAARPPRSPGMTDKRYQQVVELQRRWCHEPIPVPPVVQLLTAAEHYHRSRPRSCVPTASAGGRPMSAALLQPVPPSPSTRPPAPATRPGSQHVRPASSGPLKKDGAGSSVYSSRPQSAAAAPAALARPRSSKRPATSERPVSGKSTQSVDVETTAPDGYDSSHYLPRRATLDSSLLGTMLAAYDHKVGHAAK